MSAPIKTNYIDIDINKGTVTREFSNVILGGGDVGADYFGVRLFADGVPYSVSDTSCIGYFIRPDGNTMIISGVGMSGTRDNIAWVRLPSACYAYFGAFVLSIKIVGDGFAVTQRIIDGTIVETMTGAVIDPGNVIPSLADYTALVQRAEAATALINKFSVASELITGTRYKIKVTKTT